MGEVVNLNQFRKKRQRAEAERQAAANRTLHGRRKSDKNKDATVRQALEAALDGKKLEKDREHDGRD